MKFYESLYVTLAYPKNIHKYKIPVKNSLAIYFISIASLIISRFYILNYSLGIGSFIFMLIFIFIYEFITDAIRIALIHFLASINNKVKASFNLNNFVSGYFSIYSVFILALPFALIFKLTSFSKSVYSLLIFILFVYYIHLLYRLIKHIYKTETKLKTIIILLCPLIYEVVRIILFFIIILSLTFISAMQFIN